jgi:hypothetical protein
VEIGWGATMLKGNITIQKGDISVVIIMVLVFRGLDRGSYIYVLCALKQSFDI